MMDMIQDLFNLFQLSFVPDVGFGNGWITSPDWPANKRERDVIFDPFLSPGTLYVLDSASCVFRYAKYFR